MNLEIIEVPRYILILKYLGPILISASAIIFIFNILIVINLSISIIILVLLILIFFGLAFIKIAHIKEEQFREGVI